MRLATLIWERCQQGLEVRLAESYICAVRHLCWMGRHGLHSAIQDIPKVFYRIEVRTLYSQSSSPTPNLLMHVLKGLALCSGAQSCLIKLCAWKCTLKHLVPFTVTKGPWQTPENQPHTIIQIQQISHKASSIKARKSVFGVGEFHWPNLSPIEHLWDKLDQRLPSRLSHTISVPDLRNSSLAKWSKIPTLQPCGQPTQNSESCFSSKGWDNSILNTMD